MEELESPKFQMEYLKLKPGKKGIFFKGLFFLFIIIFLILAVTPKEKINHKASELENLFFKREKKENVQEKILPPPYVGENFKEPIVEVVKKTQNSVVSIIITKNLPVIEEEFFSPFEEFEEFFGTPFFKFKIPRFKGYKKQEVGGGTGFFVSSDGLLLTNAHVVSDKDAQYTVLTNDGKKYPAKVVAIDDFRDLALIKIEGGNFQPLPLGDSDKLEVGQTVIAIGNSLGEFRNTVSAGIISGLGRKITASGGGRIETMEDVIQTDAAINQGNSGGPLLNLKGEVIGVNFAMAYGAENIGFAIPINKAKKLIEDYKKFGKVSFAFLGVRYILIDEEIQRERNLPVDFGALILGEDGKSAIFPGSPAEKAGLREGDIILEINGQKVTKENSLAKIISNYRAGDKITLKVLRGGKEIYFEITLSERPKEIR